MHLHLGVGGLHELEPTDVRLAKVKEGDGEVDPGLVALYYQFARYLLISCSRGDTKALPANLQGIWSEGMSPPWGAKVSLIRHAATG